jgi:hypothetical protein
MPLRLQTTTCTDNDGQERDAIVWSTYPEREKPPGPDNPTTATPTYWDTQRGEWVAADPRETTASASWDTFNRPAYIHGWAVSSVEVDSLDAEAWEGASESCNHVNHIWARKRNFNAMIERFDIEHPDGWDKLGTAAGYSGPPLVYESINYDPATHDPAESVLFGAAGLKVHALRAYATTEQTGKCIKVKPVFKSDPVPIVRLNGLDGFDEATAPTEVNMNVCADVDSEAFAFYVVIAPRELGELQCGIVNNHELPSGGASGMVQR